MKEETKNVQDIYSLVIPKTNIVIPIPCINELKQKTQLSNIDLFTAHFANAEALINFCNNRGWIDYKKPIKELIIQFSTGKIGRAHV